MEGGLLLVTFLAWFKGLSENLIVIGKHPQVLPWPPRAHELHLRKGTGVRGLGSCWADNFRDSFLRQ
jgi:hypothetical protein